MIRAARVLFCDNEHGLGDVTFPVFDGSIVVEHYFVEPMSTAKLRKEAKKRGWGRINGGDYCPDCMETDS